MNIPFTWINGECIAFGMRVVRIYRDSGGEDRWVVAHTLYDNIARYYTTESEARAAVEAAVTAAMMPGLRAMMEPALGAMREAADWIEQRSVDGEDGFDVYVKLTDEIAMLEGK